jgi:NADPH:quinone reductase-like Zn-dependent oxidoreductase
VDRDVARPEPGPDQVFVGVRAAGISPSEAKLRAGSPYAARTCQVVAATRSASCSSWASGGVSLW